jgi:hypothetical protein
MMEASSGPRTRVSVTSRVVIGLAVAIGAKELEILKPIVEAVAVDVVERKRQPLTAPLRDPAVGARRRFEPFNE